MTCIHNVVSGQKFQKQSDSVQPDEVKHYLDDYFEHFDICAYEPVFSKAPSSPVICAYASSLDKNAP